MGNPWLSGLHLRWSGPFRIGVIMWTRGVIGIVLCLVGLVWLGQGTNVIRGSKMMSGHGGYAVLGGVVIAIGLGFLAWAWRVRRSRMA
jgi:hypothetical protein